MHAAYSLTCEIAVYKPFSAITQASLQHALGELSLSLSLHAITNLMSAYDSLSVFPDVPNALSMLSSSPGISAYVFSNGTEAMVCSSVNSSPSLSPHAGVFKGIVTVQEVKIFKPDPRVYRYLLKKVGKEEKQEDVWLVSGNPFDVVGARMVGMQAAWVDRAGKG
jgi:2-haloacid dehalogenase